MAKPAGSYITRFSAGQDIVCTDYSCCLIAGREEGSAAGSCCICPKYLLINTALKKCKRFYIDACHKIFNKVLSKRFQLSLDSFIETNDSYAFLCHMCDSQALKSYKY